MTSCVLLYTGTTTYQQGKTDMLIVSPSIFIFSATINISVFAYFFICPGIVEHCFGKSKCAVGGRIKRLFKNKRAVACRFFRDQVFGVFIFTYGIVLLATTDVLKEPFLNTPDQIKTLFAINLGHYVHRFWQDIFLREFIPMFKINFLHHVVTIATYTVFLWYEQNAISGIIGLLFESSTIVFEVSGFLKALGVSKNSMICVILMTIGFICTVVFRGICPVIIIGLVTSNKNPLHMEYIPLGFFFMDIVFFSMVNGWLMKTSWQSLQRRLLSRKIINELRRYQNGNRQQEVFPLNNLGDSRRAQRQPVTVVIPADDNFRLARPVSNFNMDYSKTLVSNLTLSRHERTLPSFNTIVNQTSSSTGSPREHSAILTSDV